MITSLLNFFADLGVFQMKSSIGMFLGAYSLFLAGEKSKEQDSCEVCNHLLIHSRNHLIHLFS